MNLFIDTPQRAAERLERERQLLQSGGPEPSEASGGGAAHAQGPGVDPRAAADATGSLGVARSATAGSASGASRDSRSAAEAPYSVAEEAYREEKAFGRRRARRRKLAGAARILALVVALPVVVVAVFLLSYGLTCILSGATPDELVQLYAELLARAEGLATDLVAML